MSWNVNAVKTKQEKTEVQDLLLRYDIVSLNETKTDMNVCLLGYITFRCVNSVTAHRSDTIVMVKNYLTRYVYSVDYSTGDQVWLKLKCIPGVVFGFCYVPPRDSEYFTHHAFSAIHTRKT